MPFAASVWFGSAGHSLPVSKYLAAGVITAIVGIFWLALREVSAVFAPASAILLLAGASSYAFGVKLGVWAAYSQ